MKKTLAIIGAGHLGKQIAHYAISDKHYDNVVFFDDVSVEKSSDGYEILGTSDAIEIEFKNKSFDKLIIGIGYKHLLVRKKLFERFDGKVPFGKIVHSTVWQDRTAEIKPGCVVYPGCVIDARSVVSENTILNLACTIAHDTIVGKHCFLSPRVALAGFINIGDSCNLGINSTVIDNITITHQTQLGAGTVVTKNIHNSGLFVGNPHKFVR